MKYLFIVLFTMLNIMSGYSQRNYFRHYIDIKKYEVVDSFPLERISIYSPFDYEGDKVISTGDGTYLIEMPHKDRMIIQKTKDNTKAIVVYNSYCFGRHKEFNIKENSRRIILWYEDDDLYCGYIYDKVFKVCKYFESKL